VNVGDEVMISNIHVAKSKADFKFLTLHIDDIKAAARDCGVMYLKIRRLLDPSDPGLQEPGLKEWLDAPWRYKPRQPKKPNRPAKKDKT